MKDKLPIFYFCSLISRHFPQSSSRCINCCRLHVTLNIIRLTHSADYTWPETPLAHRFKWNNLIDPTRCRGRQEEFGWRTRRQLNKLTIRRLKVSNKISESLEESFYCLFKLVEKSISRKLPPCVTAGGVGEIWTRLKSWMILIGLGHMTWEQIESSDVCVWRPANMPADSRRY